MLNIIRAKYKSTMIFNAKKSFFLRVFFYVLVSFVYFYFMSKNAPLGIDWRPLHQERVLNATNNILNFTNLIKHGYTTYLSPAQLESGLNSNKIFSFYAVHVQSYLHFVAAKLIGGEKLVINLGQYLDKFAIISSAVISAELARKFFPKIPSINGEIISFSVFSLFISSPWSYRMSLAAWLEVYVLFFFLISFLFFLNKRKFLGFLFIFLASFSQYPWGVLFFIIYFSIIFLSFISQNTKSIQLFLPPGINTPREKLFLLLSCISPCIIFIIQGLIFTINNPELSIANSTPLYRIGINSLSNIHHGGWLSSLQFLGGNRITLCLESFSQISSLNQLITLDSIRRSIFIFNCVLSIFGMYLLSIISLIGFINLHKDIKAIRFISFPLCTSIFTFALLFQQSFAVHLQGYSFIFSFIFALGIVYIAIKLLSKYGLKYYSIIIFSPIIMSIIISNIRISYITGING